MSEEIAVVTGAFGYTGRFITKELLRKGKSVRTLISHTHLENPFSNNIEVKQLNFADFSALVESLQGANVLYNTYWVRFNRGKTTFEQAVNESRILFDAAMQAGISKLVHISVTNPSLDSKLPYFRGKAEVEEHVKSSGLGYTIIRPALIFGAGDILLNNIAWLLRHFPLFLLPGNGEYLVQPIAAEELASIAVQTTEDKENSIIEALGPERISFKKLVQLIAEVIHSNSLILPADPDLALLCSKFIGTMIGDVLLTSDELKGLISNLLVGSSPPIGKQRLTTWLNSSRNLLGKIYASELARHFPITTS